LHPTISLVTLPGLPYTISSICLQEASVKEFVKGIPFGVGAAIGYIVAEAVIRWAFA